jgi:hypothetical protein
MKNLNIVKVAFLALAILLSACTPPATVTEVPTATLIPVVTEPPVPTLVPVNLSGPTAGTIMVWMDGGWIR